MKWYVNCGSVDDSYQCWSATFNSGDTALTFAKLFEKSERFESVEVFEYQDNQYAGTSIYRKGKQ